MTKITVREKAGRNGATRKRSTEKTKKKERRVILFPTEATTIPREELERAVERAIAARKK